MRLQTLDRINLDLCRRIAVDLTPPGDSKCRWSYRGAPSGSRVLLQSPIRAVGVVQLPLLSPTSVVRNLTCSKSIAIARLPSAHRRLSNLSFPHWIRLNPRQEE